MPLLFFCLKDSVGNDPFLNGVSGLFAFDPIHVPFYGKTLSRKNGSFLGKILGEGMGVLVGNAIRIVEVKGGHGYRDLMLN